MTTAATQTPPPPFLTWIAPNWFAAVMGTGIVATSAVGLPVASLASGLRPFATGVWLLGGALLLTVCALTGLQWLRHRALARSHLRHPVLIHFYGAPAMAFLTVGTGTLLLGPDLIGTTAAVRIDWVLWGIGTALGLVTCFAVPLRAFTGGLGEAARRPGAAFGGWLMPVVPPNVSASAGALLLPHLPPGQARLSLLLACYALFGISLVASFTLITQIWAGLNQHGLPEPKLVPTLFIVLGPLGQSVTAVTLLGERAHLAIGSPYAAALQAFGLIYGVPVLGFAMLWLLMAATVTARTVRTGLPFAPTWWSFTFPIGTCVTASAGLSRLTGADALTVLAVALFAVLLAAWALVGVRALGSALVVLPARPRRTRRVQPAWAYTI